MFLHRWIEVLCRSVVRHPLMWFLLTLLPTLPALLEVRQLGLNTDVVRLLPDHSPAATWTRKLQNVVGDGGFFTILYKGDNRAALLRAVETTAAKVQALPEVESVAYTHPKDFIDTYRYLLISSSYLEKILDYVVSLKAEVNPFAADLLSEKNESAGQTAKKEKEEVTRLLDLYADLPAYHENSDGTIFGIFIRPKAGTVKIHDLYGLMRKLERISQESAEDFAVWSGVGGSQINNLREYEVIRADLNRSGTITVIAILAILIFSFRSVAVLPVLLFPLASGLLWAFALVPPVLGDLNIITSFLLMVLFGLGIDSSIHLVKRFQQELAESGAEKALLTTYRSTGISVLTSGVTTGLALLVLAFSDFRGFSEFGLIGGGAMLIMLLAMFTVMPPVLLLGVRFHLLQPSPNDRRKMPRQHQRLALLLVFCLPFCLLAAALNLRFDYNFNNLKPKIAGDQTFDACNNEVYKTRYLSPGAVYLAPDLPTLDKLSVLLEERMRESGTTFLKYTSIRNYAPDDEETAKRKDLLADIKGQLSGSWLKKIGDPRVRAWAEEIRDWVPPANQPYIEDLPSILTGPLLVGDAQALFVLGLYPNCTRGNGRNAMNFTREMYDLEIPPGVQGPVGEMPVFAEILWTVTAEGPWVLVASFVAVFLLVYLGNRSLRESLWITLPLVAGLILTVGILSLVGFRLNFFNVVIFPALVGMGVDSGVHFYQRWKELRKNTGKCYQELFEPLTICTLTSIMGYSGMIFAAHPGLRSIGILACLGLGCGWLASLVLFPGVLEYLRKRGLN